jgi:hypothetical protein
VRAFKLANDHASLLDSAARGGDTPAYQAVNEVFAAFDYLNEAIGKTDTTIKRIADIVEAFYSHLVSRRLAATNPAAGLYDEFKWATNTGGDTPALSTDQPYLGSKRGHPLTAGLHRSPTGRSPD